MKVAGDYAANGYLHLQNFVPVAVTQQFLAEIREAIDQSDFAPEQLLRSAPPLKRPALEIYGYEHKPLLAFLWGLTPSLSALTGRELLPTYSYFRAYQAGDVCRVHSDRHACEHSLSLTLGYSDDAPWAFEIGRERIEKAESLADDFGSKPSAAILMQPGDGVLYQGVNYRHGRVTPNPNRWSAHVFLHWVDANGRFQDQAFDGRAITARPDFAVR